MATATESMPGQVVEAMLQAEEDLDMMRTLDLLKLAENEVHLQQEEEADMGKTMEILSNVLSDGELRFLRGSRQGKFVQFSPVVKVIVLPLEERADARQARKKYWDSGPLHDELWDGDVGAFRDMELSPEELAALLRRKTNVTTKIRGFFKTGSLNIDAKSHAKRIATEEDDDGSGANGGGMKMKRRSSSRLLSFIRRRSTKSQQQEQQQQALDMISKEWIAQVLEQSEKLNDLDLIEVDETGSLSGEEKDEVEEE